MTFSCIMKGWSVLMWLERRWNQGKTQSCELLIFFLGGEGGKPPSFLLLGHKMDVTIPLWPMLRSCSQIIDCNYSFCDNYFGTCFFHWCVIFHRNSLGRNWGCFMAVPMENNTLLKWANKEVIVIKIVITVDYLAARSKGRSMWNCEIHFASRNLHPWSF